MQLFEEKGSDGLIRLNTSGRYWSPTLIRKLMLTLPTQEKDQTMQKLSSEQQIMLRQSLEKNPGQVLEMLAGQNQCSFEDVIRCLPENCIRQTEAAASSKSSKPSPLGTKPSPSIAHTPDAIVEVTRQTARRQSRPWLLQFRPPRNRRRRTRSYLLRKLRLHLPFGTPVHGQSHLLAQLYQPQRRCHV